MLFEIERSEDENKAPNQHEEQYGHAATTQKIYTPKKTTKKVFS